MKTNELDEETKLKRRAWLIDSFEWFLEEAAFYKENHTFVRRENEVLWNWDELEGKLELK